jgi:hypothetical protein
MMCVCNHANDTAFAQSMHKNLPYGQRYFFLRASMLKPPGPKTRIAAKTRM